MTNSNLVGCTTGRSGGLAPLRDAASIDAGLTMRVRKFCSIAHQAAGFRIRAQGINRWHTVARRQSNELYATVDEQVVGMDQECVGPSLYKAPKGRVDFGSSSGGKELDLHIDGPRRGIQIFLQGLSSRIFRIDEH